MSTSPAASAPGESGERPRASAPELGIVAGRYRLIARLAEGGMGVVFKAEHTLSRKKLAIKILHPHLCHGRQAVERFKREVSAAAEIDHPGIVQVFDAGVDTDGSFYMAMELLEGESLAARTRRIWPGTRTAVQMIAEMCEPLARAHEKRFVHRDLKPDNIFVARDHDGRESLKLLDFGLAREVTRRGPTMSGVTFGTPEYMSPEQAMSAKRAGIPSDVWSVGVMLYELLAGRHPFTGETPNAVMANAIKEPLPPLSDVAPHVPVELADIVERCLEKEPTKRPANAGELGALLRQLLETVALDERTPENPHLSAAQDEDDEGGPQDDVDIARMSAASPRLDALRDEPIATSRVHRGASRAAVWPWALGGLGALALIAAAAIALGSGGGPQMVATELPSERGAVVAPVQAAVEPDRAPEAAPEPEPAVGAGSSGAVPASVGSGSSSRSGASVVEVEGADPAVEGVAPAVDPALEQPGDSEPRVVRRARASEEPAGSATALEDARACLARGDTRCAVTALQSATGAAEMALLVDLYRNQGRTADARGVMQRYLRRYPRGVETPDYQRELGLSGH